MTDATHLRQEWLVGNALAAMDAIADAIITADETGRICFANLAASALFGHGVDELVGSPVAMLMPHPLNQSSEDAFTELFGAPDKNRGVEREVTAVNKQGDLIPIYVATRVIEQPQGRFFTGTIRDLSEQVASQEEQLEQLEQRERLTQVGRLTTMGEMTASIAHEINQPLTAIALYSQACMKLLVKDPLDTERVVDSLRKLNEQSLRAGDVIERIQRFVRHEGMDKTSVNVGVLIRDLNRLASADARVHGIELKFVLEPHEMWVFCDSVQIQQVALNLIRNAIDAMDEISCRYGNVVLVNSARRGQFAEISVSDRGTGISGEEEPLIFGAFHTTKKDGMGMGLSICRSIVVEHGGQMGFSNNPDHGCTFYFRIPLGEWHE
ncbi:MAG: PAS domain-containing sensor histidine kinase [Pseudomonadota bacterium]